MEGLISLDRVQELYLLIASLHSERLLLLLLSVALNKAFHLVVKHIDLLHVDPLRFDSLSICFVILHVFHQTQGKLVFNACCESDISLQVHIHNTFVVFHGVDKFIFEGILRYFVVTNIYSSDILVSLYLKGQSLSKFDAKGIVIE